VSPAMRIVIVGCGVAGVTAARTIKESAPDVEVTVYTDENYLYYPRPRLYEVLSGQKDPLEIYSYASEWYEKLGIKVTRGKKVLSINVARKELRLERGLKTSYDKLLLANGALPFLPPIEGVEKRGTFTLRTVEDAVAIGRYAESARRAIVIGGGLLGLECAARLRKLGLQVEVVEIHQRLLPTQLDQESSVILESHIERLGIHISLGVKITEIVGKEAVAGVSLDSGEEVSGELVLITAGVKPDIKLATDAELKVDKGVVVDEHLRTSDDDVYAAGDVVEFHGQVYGIIPPAVEQADIASANMLGKEKRVYTGTVNSTTLRVASISLTSMGIVNPEESRYEEVKTVDKQNGVYKKIVLDQGRIVGAVVLGDRKGVSALMRLMQRETDVTKFKDNLLEDNFDYTQVIRNAGTY
jgi:nitrite reductase (NADH) large subunit